MTRPSMLSACRTAVARPAGTSGRRQSMPRPPSAPTSGRPRPLRPHCAREVGGRACARPTRTGRYAPDGLLHTLPRPRGRPIPRAGRDRTGGRRAPRSTPSENWSPCVILPACAATQSPQSRRRSAMTRWAIVRSRTATLVTPGRRMHRERCGSAGSSRSPASGCATSGKPASPSRGLVGIVRSPSTTRWVARAQVQAALFVVAGGARSLARLAGGPRAGRRLTRRYLHLDRLLRER
jgi:hypothetical protein